MLPRALLEEASKRGVDIVELVAKALSIDPPAVADAHLGLAEKFLEEGRRLVEADPVQASEKLYKAAEEAVKAAAVLLGLEEAERARELGRWSAAMLFSAADKISEKRREARWWWRTAWVLHVEGFHEARLRPSERDIGDVESLVKLAKELKGRWPQGRLSAEGPQD
ncbi:MAG: PaREP1 family protein [Thermoproteus sp.]|nr:PaREP1 family protein [Thermoproteus sp.]